MKFLIAVLLLTSCSRGIDQLTDDFSVNSRPVGKSKLTCYSGGQPFFTTEISNTRIWMKSGGHYFAVLDNKLLTVTGDCVLEEFFK